MQQQKPVAYTWGTGCVRPQRFSRRPTQVPLYSQTTRPLMAIASCPDYVTISRVGPRASTERNCCDILPALTVSWPVASRLSTGTRTSPPDVSRGHVVYDKNTATSCLLCARALGYVCRCCEVSVCEGRLNLGPFTVLICTIKGVSSQ